MPDFSPFRPRFSPSKDNFALIIISQKAEAILLALQFCLDVGLLCLLFIMNVQTCGQKITERKYSISKPIKTYLEVTRYIKCYNKCATGSFCNNLGAEIHLC